MEFCDLERIYSSFPDSAAVDGSRGCQTFIALYCAKRRSLVHKNLPCADKTSRTRRDARTAKAACQRTRR
jgi:hypothetical protein